MIRILLILQLTAILLQGGAAVAADQLAVITEGVREKYQHLPGLSVDYTREVITRSMSMLGSNVKGDLATGVIYFKSPYSLKLEQRDPRPETIVTGGKTLWWYVPEEKLAYEYPTDKFGKELKLLSDIFRGLATIEENFKATLLGQTPEGEYRVELDPDPSWEEVERIELIIGKDYSIRQVDILNQMGSMTRFILKDLRVVDEFPEGFFRFSVPEGVKVQKEEG